MFKFFRKAIHSPLFLAVEQLLLRDPQGWVDVSTNICPNMIYHNKTKIMISITGESGFIYTNCDLDRNTNALDRSYTMYKEYTIADSKQLYNLYMRHQNKKLIDNDVNNCIDKIYSYLSDSESDKEHLS